MGNKYIKDTKNLKLEWKTQQRFTFSLNFRSFRRAISRGTNTVLVKALPLTSS